MIRKGRQGLISREGIGVSPNTLSLYMLSRVDGPVCGVRARNEL